MNKAITLAIEGGYENAFGNGDRVGLCFLDPLFWQCLGKALGWKRPITQYAFIDENDRTTSFTARWQNEMHRFIDHIAEGKDVDEFFKNLLNQL